MKMTKKILLGMAAALVAFSFVGCDGLLDPDTGVNFAKYCKDKQNDIAYYAQIAANSTLSGSWYIPSTTYYEGDDTEGAIKGSGQKYSVNYANATENAYRAYKNTAMKHAGGLIKVSFDSNDAATVGTSKMGVIFDHKKNATNKDAVDFYIIGINPVAGKNNFYVSKMTNIVDIQADNFGATTDAAAGEPKEVEIVPIEKNANISGVAADEEGKYSYYVYYKLLTDGSFDFAVLSMTDADMKNFNTNSKFEKADINDYTVLVKGNTKAVAGAEYEAAE